MTTALGRGLAAGRHELPNGAVVISKEARTVPAVTLLVSVPAGSIYEPDEQLGLSYLTSRMLDRGTEQRTSDTIAEALDARGARGGIGPLDVERATEVMRQLRQLLAVDDAKAERLLGEHEALIAAVLPDHHRELRQAVREFDFERALEVLARAHPGDRR
jgi:hypothetical protein